MVKNNRREIKAADYAEQIIKSIPKGVLVTAKAGEKVNPMTMLQVMGTLSNWV